MKKLNCLMILLAAVAMFFGCKPKSASERIPMLEAPAGAMCDVLVVIDTQSWKGELGLAYRQVLGDQYPYLPQAEPSFKVSHVGPNIFTSSAQRYRNLIISKIGPENKVTKLIVQKNLYALNQLVVTVQAPTSLDAATLLKANAERIRNIFDQSEKERYAAMVKAQPVAELTNAVKEKFGIELYFPKGYQLRTSKPDFLWISLETTFSSQGLLIYTTPYKGPSDLSDKRITVVADSLMKLYVPGPSLGSYMITEAKVPPKQEVLTQNGREWTRLRGFWDVHNEFMGGPFISYSTLIKEKNEVLTIRAYVYSPKKEKRKPLLQTEALIYNINLDGEKAVSSK